jgi:hypothetical protein
VTTPSEEDLARRARNFDPAELWALLQKLFPDRAIHLRGNPTFALRPTPVEAVDFDGEAVTARLNLGLFSSASPLPSYFNELLASPSVGPSLGRLLEVLDEWLLRERVESLRPERPSHPLPGEARGAPGRPYRLMPGGESFRRDILQLAAPASPGALQRIAAHIFPELSVSVRRAGRGDLVPIDQPRLGHAALGAAALGGLALAPAPGLEIHIRTEESTTWRGEPWPVEAKRRTDELLWPALCGAGLRLLVLLVDLEGKGRLRVREEGALGFEPLERAETPRITVLFDGVVPSTVAIDSESFVPTSTHVRPFR